MDTKIDNGVFLRKDKLGYRLVYPYKNEDGSWNKFNLWTGGSWGNFIQVILIILLICFICWAYINDTKALADCCNKGYELCSNPINLINKINLP